MFVHATTTRIGIQFETMETKAIDALSSGNRRAKAASLDESSKAAVPNTPEETVPTPTQRPDATDEGLFLDSESYQSVRRELEA